MSRAKKTARQQAEEATTRRRNSAAHRALRRRAAQGKGALALDPSAHDGVERTDAPVTSEQSTRPGSDGEVDTAGVAPVAPSAPSSSDADDEPAVDEAVVDEPEVDEAVVDEAVDVEPAAEQPSDHETDVFDPVADTTPMPPVAPSPAPPPWLERVSLIPEPAPAEPEPEPELDAPTPVPVEPEPLVPAPEPALPEPEAPAPAPAPPAPEPVARVHEQPHEHEPEPKAAPPKRRKAWIIPFVIVGLAVLYVGAQALLSNTVPGSTHTMGVDIGGMSATQAQGEVATHADELTAADLELRAAEQVFMLPAVDAGLGIDAEATVAQVTGFTLAPDRLWAHIVGGGEIEPVVEVDEGVLADALESAATHFDGPAQDAGVTVTDGGVEVVPGRSAVTVDQEASAAVVMEQWPASQTIELAAQTEPPAVTDEDAQAFALELESQTFATSITLEGDDAQAVVEPETIARHSTVVSGASGLELEIDGEALTAAILEDNPELSTEGKNASVSFDDDHNIVIDEGAPGITIDAAQLGDAVLAASQSLDRTGVLPYTAADPEVSAEDLGLADFKEVISTFNTPLTSEWVRTENLRTAAASVTGVILQPGDTFDLTEVLSPINEESGYQASGVIVNGILTQGMGGGLSQMATNAYNAGYFAGYELIEHRPHSVWFTRYPAGRESTMYTGSINVVFRNNTPYAAVLNSYVEGGRLYTEVWSTKHFEVNTAASPRTNVRQPGVKEVTSANCRPKSAGQPGFTITNTRTVLLDGEEVDRNSDTWTYQPDDAIKCVSPDDDNDNDDD